MRNKRTIAVILIVGVILAAAIVAISFRYRDYLTLEQVRELFGQIADLGPIAFFAAMTLAPLFGTPVSPFLLLAPAFGPVVGIGGCFVALAANMTLSWFVSGKWFRPYFEGLVSRLGYSVPEMSEGSKMSVAFVLRITPGIPFTLQNYLLGLSGLSLSKYLLVSLPTTCLLAAIIVFFGDAVLEGNFKFALIALAAVVLLLVGIRLMRKRMGVSSRKGDVDGVA